MLLFYVLAETKVRKCFGSVVNGGSDMIHSDDMQFKTSDSSEQQTQAINIDHGSYER